MSSTSRPAGGVHAEQAASTANGFIALLMGTMSLGWTATAYAANIKVDTLIDGSLAGFCTLSDAFTAAKNDIAVNGCAAGSGPERAQIDIPPSSNADPTNDPIAILLGLVRTRGMGIVGRSDGSSR